MSSGNDRPGPPDRRCLAVGSRPIRGRNRRRAWRAYRKGQRPAHRAGAGPAGQPRSVWLVPATACRLVAGRLKAHSDEVEQIGESWAAVLGDYERHLRAERGLSEHSIRAYLTDLSALAAHAGRLGIEDPAALDLRALRSFLANLQTLGRARTTLARRATSARVFTAWLARTGRATADAGALLASPKSVSYTHLRAHETVLDLVCRLLLEKKK